MTFIDALVEVVKMYSTGYLNDMGRYIDIETDQGWRYSNSTYTE